MFDAFVKHKVPALLVLIFVIIVSVIMILANLLTSGLKDPEPVEIPLEFDPTAQEPYL